MTLDSKGNEIVNGFNTNMTPAQRLTSVPSSSLQSANPLTGIPQPTPDNTLSTMSSILNTQQNQAQTDANNLETQYNQTVQEGNQLNQELASKGAYQIEQENLQGIPALNKNLTDLQNLARQKTLEYQLVGQSTPYSLEGQGRGITTNLLRGQEATIQRRKQTALAIDALVANAGAEAARGNLTYAQDLADRAVALKYDPIIAKINANTKLLEGNKFMLGRADTKLANAKIQANNLQLKKIEEEMQSQKDISKLIIDASPFAPPETLKRAKDIQAKGGSATEVAMALGVYGGDYYQTALLKQQIETQKAQRAKIYSEISATEATQSKAEVDSWVSNIASGKAKLSDVPSKLKGAVSVGLSQATISSPETKAKIEASQNVYNLAQELKTLEGKGGAVGFGLKKTVFSKVLGIDETAISGTDRANYEAKFNQLKDTLASANLDKLKGAMSDKDIQFLRNIGTALTLDMPEDRFDEELNKVAKTMEQVPGVQAIQTPNKFNAALGQNKTQIQGTQIINRVNDDGSIDFKLP